MTNWLRIAAGLLVALLVAYLAGYWPERSRRLEAESATAGVQVRLDEAEARVRAAALLGALLHLAEAIEAQNYGQAQQLASRFFDEVGAEAARTPLADVRTVLQQIQQLRDGVIASLARAELAAVEALRSAELQLREALGYPVNRP